jgi:hypothetical protein
VIWSVGPFKAIHAEGDMLASDWLRGTIGFVFTILRSEIAATIGKVEDTLGR